MLKFETRRWLGAVCCLGLALWVAPLAAANALVNQFNEGAQRQGRNVTTFKETVESWPLEVYTPWNAAKARGQEAKLAAVQKKYRERVPSNETELNEISSAIAVFLRYAEIYEEFHAVDTVLVPANGLTSVNISSYCLDAGLPSPPKDEPLKLVRYSNLFPADVVPVYQSLMRYNAQQDSNSIQGLLWTLRNISDGRSKLSSLSANDLTVLERAHPGATRILQQAFALDNVLQMDGKPVRNLGDLANAHLARKVGKALDIPWQPGQSVEAMFAAASSVPVSGTANPNNAYTELAPGVIARSHGVRGHSEFRIDVVNNSSAPYVFRNTEYVAEPSRRAQRLAIGRVSNVYKPTAEAANGYRKVQQVVRDAARKPIAGAKPLATPRHECNLIGNSFGSDVFKELSSLMPIYGEMMSAYEAWTGLDFYTGAPLKLSSRLLAGLNVATLPLTPLKLATRGAKLAEYGTAFATRATQRPESGKAIAQQITKKLAIDRAAECGFSKTIEPDNSVPPYDSERWAWLQEKTEEVLGDRNNWDCATVAKKPPNGWRNFVGKVMGDEDAGSPARVLQYHICNGAGG